MVLLWQALGNAPRTTIFLGRVYDMESNGGWAAFTLSGPRPDASDDAALASYTNRTTIVVRIAGLGKHSIPFKHAGMTYVFLHKVDTIVERYTFALWKRRLM
jgi:hypothetical protein